MQVGHIYARIMSENSKYTNIKVDTLFESHDKTRCASSYPISHPIPVKDYINSPQGHVQSWCIFILASIRLANIQVSSVEIDNEELIHIC